MKDFLGNELKVGDEVVCYAHDYNNHFLGIIIRFDKNGIALIESKKFGNAQYLIRSTSLIKAIREPAKVYCENCKYYEGLLTFPELNLCLHKNAN